MRWNCVLSALQVLALSFCLLGGSNTVYGQSHLRPSCGLSADSGDSYEDTIAQLFHKGFQRTTPLRRTDSSVEVLLRMTWLSPQLVSSGEPCLTCETMSGVRVIGDHIRYEAFSLTADTTIAAIDARGADAVQNVEVHESAAPLDSSLAARVRQVWQDMLLCPRYPRSTDITVGGAGGHFIFSMLVMGIGKVAGESDGVDGVEEGTAVAHLAALGHRLGDFAEAASEERSQVLGKVRRILSKLERLLDRRGHCPAAQVRR